MKEAPYTLGLWTVKAGKEQEFVEEWNRFAGWTSRHVVGSGSATLLQDPKNEREFISFGPWDNEQAIDSWRAAPEFQEFLTKARSLCDMVQPRTMRLVSSLE